MKYTITNLWDDIKPVCKKHGCELETQEHNGYVFYVCPKSIQSNGYHNERIPIFIYTDFIDKIAKDWADGFPEINGKQMRSKNFKAEIRQKENLKYDLLIDFSESR